MDSFKKYIKDGNILPYHKIIIEKDGITYINPSLELLISEGWNEYIEQDVVKSIEEYRHELINYITQYDKSENVNVFYIKEEQTWIDRDTRVSLMNSTNILKNAGLETTTLWLNGKPYVISCDLLIQMLGALEIYALQCYHVTEQHKANINALETIDAINLYDYKAGYPEKLVFNV